MSVVAKNKKQNGEDRHTSGFMVRLPEVYRTRLQPLCAQTWRTMTAEIQIALEEHLGKASQRLALNLGSSLDTSHSCPVRGY